LSGTNAHTVHIGLGYCVYNDVYPPTHRLIQIYTVYNASNTHTHTHTHRPIKVSIAFSVTTKEEWMVIIINNLHDAGTSFNL